MMTFFGLPGVKAANDDYPAQCTFASSVSYGFRAIVPNLIRAATCWEDPYLQYALHFCDLVHRRAQLDTLEVKHHAFRRVFFDDVILDNIRWELFRLGWRRSEMEAYFEAELACREANHAIVFGEESQEGCQQCKEAAYDKILALTLNIGPAMWTMPFARELKRLGDFLSAHGLVRSIACVCDQGTRSADLLDVFRTSLSWDVSIKLWTSVSPGYFSAHDGWNLDNVSDIAHPPWQHVTHHGVAGADDPLLFLEHGHVGFLSPSALSLAAQRSKRLARFMREYRLDIVKHDEGAILRFKPQWRLLAASWLDTSEFNKICHVDICASECRLAYGVIISLPALLLAARTYWSRSYTQTCQAFFATTFYRRLPRPLRQLLARHLIHVYLFDARTASNSPETQRGNASLSGTEALDGLGKKAAKRRLRSAKERELFEYTYNDTQISRNTHEVVNDFLAKFGMEEAGSHVMPIDTTIVSLETERLVPSVAYTVIVVKDERYGNPMIKTQRRHFVPSSAEDWRLEPFAEAPKGSPADPIVLGRAVWDHEADGAGEEEWGDHRGWRKKVEDFVGDWELEFKGGDVTAGGVFGTAEEARATRAGERASRSPPVGWLVTSTTAKLLRL